MKFEKKIDSSTGKALIYLNLEGLKLKNLQFDYEPLLYFKVETYDALRASKTEKSWNDVFGVVHDFLNTLSKEYQSKFATGFKISYEDNGYGTGSIMCVNPQYKNIEAMQFINDNYDDIKSFIESKTTLLSDIHQIDDSPCMDYPII